METSVHNLWMLAAWTAYVDKRRGGWVGAFVALGILTRPDAAIWAAPLLLHQLWSAWHNRNSDSNLINWLPLQDYGVGLLIGLPWTIFAAIYFGSPIPHTVGTKAVVYKVDSTQALVRFLQHYATPFHQHLILGVFIGILIGIFLFPTLALIGLRISLVKDKYFLPMLVYPWLYIGLYAALNPLVFRWYLTPPLPAYILAILGGGFALHRDLKLNRFRYVGVVLGILPIIFLLSAWEISPNHGTESTCPRNGIL